MDIRNQLNIYESKTADHYCALLKGYNALNVSVREFQCFSLWIAGNRAKQIAKVLSLSPRTIETHIYNLKIKNKINSREETLKRLHKINLYHSIIFYADTLMTQLDSGR